MTWLPGECENAEGQRQACAVAWPLQTAGMGVIVCLADGTLQAVNRVRLLGQNPSEGFEQAIRYAQIRLTVA